MFSVGKVASSLFVCFCLVDVVCFSGPAMLSTDKTLFGFFFFFLGGGGGGFCYFLEGGVGGCSTFYMPPKIASR